MKYVALLLLLLLACGSQGDPQYIATPDGGRECKYIVAVNDLDAVKEKCRHWQGYDFVDFDGRHVIYVCDSP